MAHKIKKFITNCYCTLPKNRHVYCHCAMHGHPRKKKKPSS